MDVEITTLREESHTKTNIIWYQLYMESKINNTIYLQNKNRLTDIKNKFMVTVTAAMKLKDASSSEGKLWPT